MLRCLEIINCVIKPHQYGPSTERFPAYKPNYDSITTSVVLYVWVIKLCAWTYNSNSKLLNLYCRVFLSNDKLQFQISLMYCKIVSVIVKTWLYSTSKNDSGIYLAFYNVFMRKQLLTFLTLIWPNTTCTFVCSE